MARVAHGRRVLVEGALQSVCCGDWRGKDPRTPDSPPFAGSPALERARLLSICPSIREETSPKGPAHTVPGHPTFDEVSAACSLSLIVLPFQDHEFPLAGSRSLG